MNQYEDLPRAAMRKVVVAFDVDGTLRCNCTETCQDPNLDIVELFRIFKKFKNVELYVWSGGGAEYAYGFALKYDLGVKKARCISKFAGLKPDIAIDDIQETDLASLNLIVREK